MVSRRSWLQGMGALGLGVAGCKSDESPTDAGGAVDADVPSDGGMADAMSDAGTDASDASEDAGNDAPLPAGPFRHGVASGDPTADGVILWTRYNTSDTEDSVEVSWSLASDSELSDVVQSGTFTTSASRDYTVKIDVTGLDPATTYYYQFERDGERSIVGRTKTAPSGSTERLRFGVMSCASMGHGWFHCYRYISELRGLDAIIFLGDYIYEYASGGYGRTRSYDPPHEIVSLEDYRRRYAHYRTDPDLQAAHQQHPFIAVWDDHESANNSWRDGAENHDSDEGSWDERLSAAYQAFIEWMPIREVEELRLWRKLSYGDLVDLVMLDTRVWGRDEQAGQDNRYDEGRQLLGMDQEQWLSEQLSTSTATWKVLGQQVMMAQYFGGVDPMELGGGNPINLDQWDGYALARERVLDMLAEIDGGVVLTGDIHSSWACELTKLPHDGTMYDPDTGDGSVGVEFVCSGVTSPGIPGVVGVAVGDTTKMLNPHVKYLDFTRRGYAILDVTTERAQADFFLVDGVEANEGDLQHYASWQVATGTNHLVEVDEPASEPDEGAELAPGSPGRNLSWNAL